VSLIIGFDKQKPTDLTYQMDGVTVLVDKKHTMYLIGKKVDFYEGADARGFLFVENP
jgi:iron-sulfur cluster assembly protein